MVSGRDQSVNPSSLIINNRTQQEGFDALTVSKNLKVSSKRHLKNEFTKKKCSNSLNVVTTSSLHYYQSHTTSRFDALAVLNKPQKVSSKRNVKSEFTKKKGPQKYL